MKKFFIFTFSVLIFASCILNAAAENSRTQEISYNYSFDIGTGYATENVHTRQMEKLNRGLAAVKTTDGVYLSWRLFDSEDAVYGSAKKNVSFNIYRDNTKIDEVSGTTNYTDTTAGTSYSVAPVINGKEGDKCEAVTVKSNSYFDIPLVKPKAETVYDNSGNVVYENIPFFPADCSTGDVDGDGEYEIIIKWTSSEHDVGSPGDPSYSGTVRFAAYKLDGTKLWDNDINLGKNVYSSAHTVQFLVYDFDGDGKAEMMCQTSLGSKDAKGNYVSHASADETISAFTDEENESADFRNAGWGLITTGEEFLTVFSGMTGEAIDTINLPTARGNVMDWGDANSTAGNRVNRFLADVAYLDGEKPYAVYMRGYYFGKDGNGRQRTSIAGISFDGERLSPDYRFDTKKGQPGYYDGAAKYVGQGNHNCTVADVDNDGKDEFITGALCMEVKDDNSFKPRWCTFMEHGDALHIGDYDPTRNGLEFFTVHEDAGPNTMSGETVEINYGMSVIDANTGEIILHVPNTKDTGRGCMANIGSGGYYQITGVGSYQCNGGTNFTPTNYGAGSNFRIFWDGDLYDELLDGTTVTNWNGSKMVTAFSATGCTKINGTKSNPALQADLFGDWREELVYPTTDGSKLRVFMTTTPTEYKIKTLMHDPVYRSGVAAEQTAYNQPPHVGFYMSDSVFSTTTVEKIEIASLPSKVSYTQGENFDTSGLTVKVYKSDGTTEITSDCSVSGYNPLMLGNQTITVSHLGKTASFEITVREISYISIASLPQKVTYAKGQSLNLSGLVVKAYYSDGKSQEITDYELSGYDANTLGKQTVIITYMNKTTSFKVTVTNVDISAVNGAYQTSSTSSVMDEIPIGNYSGSFTIEHSVTINSLPANGNADKNNTDGFFMRFMGVDANNLTHTGGGWYLTQSGSQAQVVWKHTQTTSIGRIDIGKTYTFKYDFSNVGTGAGATVTLTIIDSDGNTVASKSNLNLRNFHDTDTGKLAPITYVQIYNQAKANSEASVTISNAIAYSDANIVDVSGNQVKVNVSSLSNIKIYAAKYDDGILTDIETLKPTSTGESTINASFSPDKVFIWTDSMFPLDVWGK